MRRLLLLALAAAAASHVPASSTLLLLLLLHLQQRLQPPAFSLVLLRLAGKALRRAKADRGAGCQRQSNTSYASPSPCGSPCPGETKSSSVAEYRKHARTQARSHI